jgi:hypothetical protein
MKQAKIFILIGLFFVINIASAPRPSSQETPIVLPDKTFSAITVLGEADLDTLLVHTQALIKNLRVTGNVTFDQGLTVTGLGAGVVHSDVNGTLSSSPIVDADIANGTITNAKLATISAADIPGTIVVRDGLGDFATNMITIDGTVTNPTDVATKAYVDATVPTFLVAKAPAVVVSTTNIILTGTQTIDGVSLVANDRVLLVGQTNSIENGLWLVQAGAWTRPADFASGSVVGSAIVLILSGAINAGSSWLASTPVAIVDTDPITFAEFTIPTQITGANVGAGAGQIFRDKTGLTLNFKTIAAGPHMTITNNANDVTIGTDATSADTAGTIVARDGSGGFSAGTITANLSGNATTATTATNFSGSLSGDVTGTQSATVVSLVGGQTAANVAAATVLANAATSANTANAIVRRDGSGGFSAGTITANLTGNVTGGTVSATTLSTSGLATLASVSVTGDETVNGNVNWAVSTVVNKPAGTRFLHTTGGTTNVFLGGSAGNLTVTGTGNTGIGSSALTLLSSGNNNTALGVSAGSLITTGSNDIVIGNAGVAAENNTIRIGTSQTGNFQAGISGINNAGASDTSAVSVSVAGQLGTGEIWNDINLADTSGFQGAILKSGNLFIHNFGTENTFVGVNSGNRAVTLVGNQNTGIGTQALSSLTGGAGFGSYNTAVGAYALQLDTSGAGNTAVGMGALNANTGGHTNVAVGVSALIANEGGSSNVAVGANALHNNNSSSNVAVGMNALYNNNGSSNVGIGQQAFNSNFINGLTTGSLNVGVGYQTGNAYTGAESNNILIQHPGVVGENNTIRIGTTGVGSAQQNRCFIAGITSAGPFANTVTINPGTGQLGGLTSSRTVKENIEPISSETANAFFQLKPSKFYYKNDPDKNTWYGFIAEDVEPLMPEIVTYQTNEKGIKEPHSINYNVMYSLLLKLVQDNRKFINELKENNKIDVQSSQISENIKQISQEVMDEFMKLEPLSFIIKGDATKKIHYGFILEELEKRMPELVQYDENGNVSAPTFHIIYALLHNQLKKVTQELNILKEDYRNQIEQMKEEIRLLKKYLCMQKEGITA